MNAARVYKFARNRAKYLVLCVFLLLVLAGGGKERAERPERGKEGETREKHSFKHIKNPGKLTLEKQAESRKYLAPLAKSKFAHLCCLYEFHENSFILELFFAQNDKV